MRLPFILIPLLSLAQPGLAQSATGSTAPTSSASQAASTGTRAPTTSTARTRAIPATFIGTCAETRSNYFCYYTQRGWNSAAASYVQTGLLSEKSAASDINAAVDNFPTPLQSALRSADSNGPALYTIFEQELSRVPTPARDVYSTFLAAALSLQSQGSGGNGSTLARATATPSVQGGATNGSVANPGGAGNRTTTTSASSGGSTSSTQGAGSQQTSSSRAVGAVAAKPTDLGLVMMAGVVAGVAGLAYGL